MKNELLIPPPLPATRQELAAMRKTKMKQSLSDHVEPIHFALWEEDDYRRMLEAVQNKQAVEGSVIADDLIAAQMIRTRAAAEKNPQVMHAQLTAIKTALGTVLRRFGVSRKERKAAATIQIDSSTVAAE